jgi:hypothetical protein
MHIGYDLSAGINQHNRLAIRHLNAQIGSMQIGYQGIPDARWHRIIFTVGLVAAVDHENMIAMDLPGKNEVAASETAGDNSSVFFNIMVVIANSKSDIKTSEGAFAVSGFTRKNTMRDRRDTAKPIEFFELIKGGSVFGC